jgi:hypothetical protein
MRTKKKRSVSRSQRKVGGVKRSNSKKNGARAPKRIRTRGKVRSKKTAKKEYKLRSSGQKKRSKRRVDRRTLKKKKMMGGVSRNIYVGQTYTLEGEIDTVKYHEVITVNKIEGGKVELIRNNEDILKVPLEKAQLKLTGKMIQGQQYVFTTDVVPYSEWSATVPKGPIHISTLGQKIEIIGEGGGIPVFKLVGETDNKQYKMNEPMSQKISSGAVRLVKQPSDTSSSVGAAAASAPETTASPSASPSSIGKGMTQPPAPTASAAPAELASPSSIGKEIVPVTPPAVAELPPSSIGTDIVPVTPRAPTASPHGSEITEAGRVGLLADLLKGANLTINPNSIPLNLDQQLLFLQQKIPTLTDIEKARILGNSNLQSMIDAYITTLPLEVQGNIKNNISGLLQDAPKLKKEEKCDEDYKEDTTKCINLGFPCYNSVDNECESYLKDKLVTIDPSSPVETEADAAAEGPEVATGAVISPQRMLEGDASNTTEPEVAVASPVVAVASPVVAPAVPPPYMSGSIAVSRVEGVGETSDVVAPIPGPNTSEARRPARDGSMWSTQAEADARTAAILKTTANLEAAQAKPYKLTDRHYAPNHPLNKTHIVDNHKLYYFLHTDGKKKGGAFVVYKIDDMYYYCYIDGDNYSIMMTQNDIHPNLKKFTVAEITPDPNFRVDVNVNGQDARAAAPTKWEAGHGAANQGPPILRVYLPIFVKQIKDRAAEADARAAAAAVVEADPPADAVPGAEAVPVADADEDDDDDDEAEAARVAAEAEAARVAAEAASSSAAEAATSASGAEDCDEAVKAAVEKAAAAAALVLEANKKTRLELEGNVQKIRALQEKCEGQLKLNVIDKNTAIAEAYKAKEEAKTAKAAEEKATAEAARAAEEVVKAVAAAAAAKANAGNDATAAAASAKATEEAEEAAAEAVKAKDIEIAAIKARADADINAAEAVAGENVAQIIEKGKRTIAEINSKLAKCESDAAAAAASAEEAAATAKGEAQAAATQAQKADGEAAAAKKAAALAATAEAAARVKAAEADAKANAAEEKAAAAQLNATGKADDAALADLAKQVAVVAREDAETAKEIAEAAETAAVTQTRRAEEAKKKAQAAEKKSKATVAAQKDAECLARIQAVKDAHKSNVIAKHHEQTENLSELNTLVHRISNYTGYTDDGTKLTVTADQAQTLIKDLGLLGAMLDKLPVGAIPCPQGTNKSDISVNTPGFSKGGLIVKFARGTIPKFKKSKGWDIYKFTDFLTNTNEEFSIDEYKPKNSVRPAMIRISPGNMWVPLTSPDGKACFQVERLAWGFSEKDEPLVKKGEYLAAEGPCETDDFWKHTTVDDIKDALGQDADAADFKIIQSIKALRSARFGKKILNLNKKDHIVPINVGWLDLGREGHHISFQEWFSNGVYTKEKHVYNIPLYIDGWPTVKIVNLNNNELDDDTITPLDPSFEVVD